MNGGGKTACQRVFGPLPVSRIHACMSKLFAIPKEQIKQLVSPMGGCFITDRVTVDGCKIGYMYREDPDRPEDSGWRFFSGDESQDYIDDLSHTGIYAVNTAANYDADIIPYLETPAPCAFEKVAGGKYAGITNATWRCATANGVMREQRFTVRPPTLGNLGP